VNIKIVEKDLVQRIAYGADKVRYREERLIAAGESRVL
jgi:hypothetical protein